MPFRSGKPGAESMTSTRGGGGLGGGLVGRIIGRSRSNKKFDPTKPISEDNMPMERAGAFRSFFGDPSDAVNANAMLAEHQALQEEARMKAMAELQQQNALALERERANNELKRIEVGANVSGAELANKLRMEQEMKDRAADKALRETAAARAWNAGELNSEVPYAPDYPADFDRLSQDSLIAERAKGLQRGERAEDVKNEEAVARATAATAAAKANQRYSTLPVPLGQNFFGMPGDGKIFEVQPGQVIETPEGFDPNTLKRTPKITTRFPAHMRPVNMDGMSGGLGANQRFVLGDKAELPQAGNNGEATTQSEEDADQLTNILPPLSPSVPRGIARRRAATTLY